MGLIFNLEKFKFLLKKFIGVGSKYRVRENIHEEESVLLFCIDLF
jgi:hypothetical protein